MIDPNHPMFNLKHTESDSMLLLQVGKKNNQIRVEKIQWIKGNVISLVDVRKVLAMTSKVLLGAKNEQ